MVKHIKRLPGARSLSSFFGGGGGGGGGGGRGKGTGRRGGARVPARREAAGEPAQGRGRVNSKGRAAPASASGPAVGSCAPQRF